MAACQLVTCLFKAWLHLGSEPIEFLRVEAKNPLHSVVQEMTERPYQETLPVLPLSALGTYLCILSTIRYIYICVYINDIYIAFLQHSPCMPTFCCRCFVALSKFQRRAGFMATEIGSSQEGRFYGHRNRFKLARWMSAQGLKHAERMSRRF